MIPLSVFPIEHQLSSDIRYCSRATPVAIVNSYILNQFSESFYNYETDESTDVKVKVITQSSV